MEPMPHPMMIKFTTIQEKELPRRLQRLAFAQLCQRRLCPPSLSAHTSPDLGEMIGAKVCST